MSDLNHLVQSADSLTKEERKAILCSLSEREIHICLKELFSKMESKYTVEITHGSDEFGKDLVILKKDEFGLDVIGVVVKKGDIKGTTAGDVDDISTITTKMLARKSKLKEIESQIKQALAHEAELKTVLNKLTVTKVYVILVGIMSGAARDRLLKEKRDIVQLFDIEWLIEKFTSYYPQVFFEGIVFDYIQNRIIGLEAKHMLSKKGINLSQYFTEPLVTETSMPIKMDEESISLILSKKRIPFFQLRSLLSLRKKVILVGEPGVGKSAALAKLTIDVLKEASSQLAKRDVKAQIEIPLLVQAKDLLKIESVEELVSKSLQREELRARFKICSLMIDALDEVSANHRKEVLAKGEEFCIALSCCLIITSRKVDAIETTPLGFERYELMPFEFGQALKLVGKIVNNKKTLGVIKEALEKIKYQIPLIPLSLMLLIELAEEHKEIPASITELYDRFFDIALGRYDRDKGIEVLFEYFMKKAFLSSLAYEEYFKKDNLEISKQDYDSFVQRYTEKYGWNVQKAGEFTDEISRAGILGIKNSVIFRHRSFLDYFTAYNIFEKREEIADLQNTLVDAYFNDIWEDVAFFYIGLKREIQEAILDKIFAAKGEDTQKLIDKFLVGRLLQAGWNSPSQLKYHGIEKALAHAPLIYERMAKIIEKNDKLPKIFADLLVMSFAEYSFGSYFLFKEGKSVLESLISKGGKKEDIFMFMPLFWSFRRFFSKEELRSIVNNTLGAIGRSTGIYADEEARILLFLRLVEADDEKVVKKIEKRLQFLTKKYPSSFRGLLPKKKKGFR